MQGCLWSRSWQQHFDIPAATPNLTGGPAPLVTAWLALQTVRNPSSGPTVAQVFPESHRRLQARSARLVREEAEDPEQEKWVMRGLELDSDLRHRVRIDIAQARAK
ncbi:unnamed protein product, partial [Polarella glacialis]